MGADRKRGLRLGLDELEHMGVELLEGTRFETDQLDLYRAVYEIVELSGNGARLRRIAWSDRVRPDAPKRARDRKR